MTEVSDEDAEKIRQEVEMHGTAIVFINGWPYEMTKEESE